ncbi:MAG TPA: ribonuclease P protein component [Planctomycetaceae bacterium]|nr:ribonuclease P protein component [Planctomycetaceae bacterium]
MVAKNETEFRFQKKQRLLRTTDFRRVYAQRQSVAIGPLVMYGAEQVTKLSHARIGISVSRRVGNAVARNQWKRRLREAFRKVKTQFSPDFDVVVVVRATGKPATGQNAAMDTEQLLLGLMNRLRLKVRRSGE